MKGPEGGLGMLVLVKGKERRGNVPKCNHECPDAHFLPPLSREKCLCYHSAADCDGGTDEESDEHPCDNLTGVGVTFSAANIAHQGSNRGYEPYWSASETIRDRLPE